MQQRTRAQMREDRLKAIAQLQQQKIAHVGDALAAWLCDTFRQGLRTMTQKTIHGGNIVVQVRNRPAVEHRREIIIGEYHAPRPHTVAVDPRTHRIYLPLENVDGHPELRILAPGGTIRR